MDSRMMTEQLHNVWEWTKRAWRKLLVGLFGIGVALGAPLVPVDMEWIISYETVAFATPDGDIAMDEYAVHGDRFLIREVPKDQGSFTATTSREAIVGKTKVQIRAQKSPDNPDCTGCAYYAEFVGRDGGVVREAVGPQDYRALDRKGAGQPKKTELVSLASADEGG